MAKRPKGAPDGPGPSLIKLAQRVLTDPEEVSAFIAALSRPEENNARGTQSAVVAVDPALGELPFSVEPSSPWMPPWTFRLSPNQKPGASVLHEQGKIYCLDLSSVFEASVFQSVDTRAPFVLDMCASPGGKAICAARALSPSTLIANEVIGKRTAQLISNLRRCRINNAHVTSLDPSRMEEFLAETCDLVIVDAPCSGQSLLARGKHSPGCFHPATIRMNAKRQRRILSCSGKLVARGGFVAYMTCTFSREENEDVIEWFLEKNPEFSGIEVTALAEYQSQLTTVPCYRMWPHRGEGSGGFTSLLRRKEEPLDPKAEFSGSLPTVWSGN